MMSIPRNWMYCSSCFLNSLSVTFTLFSRYVANICTAENAVSRRKISDYVAKKVNSGRKSAEWARMRPGKDYVACAELAAGLIRGEGAGGWPGRGVAPSGAWSKCPVVRLAFCEESGSKKGFTELQPYKNVVIWSPAGNLIWRKRSNK